MAATTATSSPTSWNSSAVPSSSSAPPFNTTLTYSTTAVPLTTIFTPAPDCSSDLLAVVTSGGTVVAVTTGRSSCFPPEWNPLTVTPQIDNTVVVSYYSPGVCPSGYTTVFARTNVEQDIRTGPSKYQDVATTAICCPTFATSLGTYSTFFTNCNGVLTSYTTIPWRFNFTGALKLTVVDEVSIEILAYTIVWKSSDLAHFTPVSAPLLQRHARSSTSIGQFSIGAKAGLGVGIAIGVLAVLAFAWVLMRRTRTAKRKREQATPSVSNARHGVDDAEGKPELHSGREAWELGSEKLPYEVYADVGNELSPDGDAHEVEAQAPVRYELHGDYHAEELTDLHTPIDPIKTDEIHWKTEGLSEPTFQQAIDRCRAIVQTHRPNNER